MEYKGAQCSKSHFFHLVNNHWECLHSLLLNRKGWEFVHWEYLWISEVFEETNYNVFLYSLEIFSLLYPEHHVWMNYTVSCISPSQYSFKKYWFIYFVYVGCMCMHMHTTYHRKHVEARGQLSRILLFFYHHMGPRDWTQTIMLGDKCLYSLFFSCIGPFIFISFLLLASVCAGAHGSHGWCRCFLRYSAVSYWSRLSCWTWSSAVPSHLAGQLALRILCFCSKFWNYRRPLSFLPSHPAYVAITLSSKPFP